MLHNKKFEKVFEDMGMDASTFAKILDWIVITQPTSEKGNDEDDEEEDGLDYDMFIEKFLEMDEEKVTTYLHIHTS